MRLSATQTQTILHCVRQQFGADAAVMLFGSRLDDAARGGDVDLLVESQSPPTLRQRSLAKMALERALNLSVDIVAMQRHGGQRLCRALRRFVQQATPELSQGAAPSSAA